MVSLEQVKEQMKKVNVRDTFGTKKEIKFLPEVLRDDEVIKYMTSGFLEGNTWLVTCTNKRIIFLDKGMVFGLKQKEIPLEKINSIGQKRGLLLGKIEIWDGASKILIDSIDKDTLKPMIDAINSAREALKSEDRPQSSNNITAQEDIPLQIKKLAELKDQGILTEEEFTKKKTELLSKM
ncbi:PH domain-containing protein [Clostridium tyrobutyricum]|uniref:PH domain-containing protein n=1 Tax=Clostridium tyrobutyricum TaxID=1519 RepID=UPI001C3DB073|nr:PH domain-containing protein [Clostridium tyrobutyricum]MBV4438584.1 PH domain-containing protein [Clostridium tyrobutyricum]